MRILMLGWEFPPYISGGLGTACQGITDGLTQLGHEIIFVLPKVLGAINTARLQLLSAADFSCPLYTEELEPVLPSKPQTIAAELKLLPIDSPLQPYFSSAQYSSRPHIDGLATAMDGDQLEYVASPQAGDYGQNLVAEVIRYGMAVGSLAMTHSFDIIHAHDWMSVFAGVNARLVSGKPLILHIHSLEIDRSGANVNGEILEIESYGLKQADHIIAVSHYTKSRIVNFYGIAPERITVVHNAVSQQEARRQRATVGDKNIKTVFFLGRITFQKGPDYFVEAAARVLQIMPNVRFIMAGTGDMTRQMVERVAELGIGANFHFTGFLKGKEVENAYAMSDLYVMPSVSEPFGISPLEAMSYDVPVIISKQSGVSELIKHALKVDFWNIDEIADRIVALLRHPVLADELKDRGWEEIKKIRWDKAAEKIAEVYGRAILEKREAGS